MRRDNNILTYFRRLIVFVLLLLAGATAVDAQQTAASQQTLREQKSLMGIEVHFRFDQSSLDLAYMGNQLSLQQFDQVIDSIGLQRIDSVVIVSQSSPEGVYEHNLKLSRQRAATMRRIVDQRHPQLNERLHVHPDGESWAQLRDYVSKDTKMKQSTIDQVIAIIDSDVNIGTKKWRLEQLPIYRYLRMTYFPLIRNSVFCIIYYDTIVVEEPVAPEVEEPVEEEVIDTIPPVDTIPAAKAPVYTHVPMMNVHSNLLYDLGTVLNAGVEFYLRNTQWSILADYTFPWWQHAESHRYFQMINGQLEARRWFKDDNSFSGHYLSAYGHANMYDLGFNGKRGWQGEGWGLGLGYGYVWHPWKNERWKVEAFVKVGYYHSLFDPYVVSDPFNGKYYYDWSGPLEDFIPRNHRLRWFGPTGVGITLSYDLIQRKIKVED